MKHLPRRRVGLGVQGEGEFPIYSFDELPSGESPTFIKTGSVVSPGIIAE